MKKLCPATLSRLKKKRAGVDSAHAPVPVLPSVFAVLAEAVPSRHDSIVPVIMIILFMAMIVVVGIMREVVRYELRRHEPAGRATSGPKFPSAVFEAPNRWLAVRSQSSQAVQTALGLQHARACTWSDALGAPFEPRLFIAPPVDGWVLVMGCDLPDPADDIDDCFKFLVGLSEKLGEVQFFSRHRAVSHHGWARLEGGQVLRAYAWAGETLWNQGEMTDAERELKLRCLAYSQSSNVLGLAEREILALNTERVVRLAARWSLDPTTVSGPTLEGPGIAGDLLHGRYH